MVNFPMPEKDDTVSQPVIEWAANKFGIMEACTLATSLTLIQFADECVESIVNDSTSAIPFVL